MKPHKMKKFKARVRLQQIIEEWKQTPEYIEMINRLREKYRPFWELDIKGEKNEG